MKNVVLVQGLPQSGKTTISEMLASKLQAARVSAEDVRQNVSTDLEFSVPDRVEHARRMAHIARLAVQGRNRSVVVDFVCPTENTRGAFVQSLAQDVLFYTVWMNTISVSESPFQDTNRLYVPPSTSDFIVQGYQTLSALEEHAEQIVSAINAKLLVRTYLVRYNTHCGDTPYRWRVIDAGTGEERLAVSFKTHGCVVRPGHSVEHGVDKWNVAFEATAKWENLSDNLALHVDFY